MSCFVEQKGYRAKLFCHRLTEKPKLFSCTSLALQLSLQIFRSFDACHQAVITEIILYFHFLFAKIANIDCKYDDNLVSKTISINYGLCQKTRRCYIK